jgi:hypothetical protein
MIGTHAGGCGPLKLEFVLTRTTHGVLLGAFASTAKTYPKVSLGLVAENQGA